MTPARRFAAPAAVVAAVFAFAAPARAGAPVNLEDGLYRLSVELEIPGRGPANPGPLTRDVCIRPDEVSRLAMPPNSPCQVVGLDIKPRRMHWKVSCQQGTMRSRVEGLMEFAGRSLSAAILVVTAPPYAMTIKQSLTGTYLGPCPAGTAAGAAPLQRYGGLPPYPDGASAGR